MADDVEEVIIQEAEAPPVEAAPSVPDATGHSAATPTPLPDAEPPLPTEVAGLRAAVSAERAEKKQAKETAQRLEQQVAELNAWVAQTAPYVQFLQANPHVFDPKARQPQAPPPQGEQPPDPRLVAYAQKLDLWTDQGKPDLKRAAELLTMLREDAKAEAQQLVQPFQQQSVQQQSALNFQQALQSELHGRKPDPKTLSDVFKNMGPQMTSTPNGAALAVLLSLGMTPPSNAIPAPPGPPQFTEASGGQATVTKALSQLEQRIVAERGIPAQKWAETVAGYKSGQPTVMEE